MANTVQWNDSVFRSGIDRFAAKKKVDTATAVNQALLDIAVDSWKQLGPQSDTEAQRRRAAIKRLMNEPLSTLIKRAHSGKRKGMYLPRVAKRRQLQRKHLIAQYWVAKRSGTGLYGTKMLRYSGKMSQNRQKGVGSVKAVLMPVIRALNAGSKYRVSFNRLFLGISQWPGSTGYGGRGEAQLAKISSNPRALFKLFYHARKGQGDKIQHAYDWAVGNAFFSKKQHFAQQLQKDMDAEVAKFNAQQK
jgi:hypothetical protein